MTYNYGLFYLKPKIFFLKTMLFQKVILYFCRSNMELGTEGV